MGWLLVFVTGLLLVFGIPLAAVGLILRLCEWSWQKPAGSLGSLGLLGAGALLCLPLLLLVLGAALATVLR